MIRRATILSELLESLADPVCMAAGLSPGKKTQLLVY